MKAVFVILASVKIIISLWLLLLSMNLYCSDAEDLRGGIEFSISGAEIVEINPDYYLSFNILVSGTDVTDRIGTGVVLISYNPESFGEFVFNNNNVVVTKGDILQTSPLIQYGIIVNDSSPDCLAITYEYTSEAGAGNFLTQIPRQLCNVKMKILSYGWAAGIGFNQSLMNGQQYQDDNFTVFNPITTAGPEVGYLPMTPLNLTLSYVEGVLMLSWQNNSGYQYNVYSSDSPSGGAWQPIATALTQPQWIISEPEHHKFYRVTAQSNMERNQ
jgi:hypothetical protein